jgi:hypothetical protein
MRNVNELWLQTPDFWATDILIPFNCSRVGVWTRVEIGDILYPNASLISLVEKAQIGRAHV